MSSSGTGSCAIIVSFNPDVPVLMALLQRIAEERDFLLIDNHSANLPAFSTQVLALPRCLGLETLSTNCGLAHALNIGLRQAISAGYRLAFLFDQDSVIPPGFFIAMEAAFHSAGQELPSELAALGPRIEHPQSGRTMPFKVFNRLFRRSDRQLGPGSLFYETGFLISSGTLLSLAAVQDIGLMKEDYFIDNVDLEWCFRATAKGYSLAGTDHAVLLHRIGEPGNDNLLMKMGLMTWHPPQRSYFTTRNRLHLYRMPYAPLGWKLRDGLRFVLKTLLLLVFSSQRKAYWQQIRRGLADSRKLS
ncbi:MAG: hypothetical protein RQ757_10055 [Pseudomonadales bacterium]|nr:hypothetical protein [Pseudomonadales bacterium]